MKRDINRGGRSGLSSPNRDIRYDEESFGKEIRMMYTARYGEEVPGVGGRNGS